MYPPKKFSAAFYLGKLSFFLLLNKSVLYAKFVYDMLIENKPSVLCYRTNRQFCMAGRAKLMGKNNIEVGTNTFGSLAGNCHTTTRYAKYDNIFAAIIIQFAGEKFSSFFAIGKRRPASRQNSYHCYFSCHSLFSLFQ